MPAKDLTDWKLLRGLSDEEIDARAADDPDAQPTDAEFWRDAEVMLPPGKTRIVLDLDDDVLEWFKAQGRAYGQRMSEALRAFVAHRRDMPHTADEIAEQEAVYDASRPDRRRRD